MQSFRSIVPISATDLGLHTIEEAADFFLAQLHMYVGIKIDGAAVEIDEEARRFNLNCTLEAAHEDAASENMLTLALRILQALRLMWPETTCLIDVLSAECRSVPLANESSVGAGK